MTSIVPIQDIAPYTQIIATSGQTQFDTLWTADDDGDVVVYARADGATPDDAADLVSPADYTVSYVGADEKVRVTFLVGRTLDDIVTIMRATPVERLNLYTGLNFTPSMLNGDFGKQTMMIQEREYCDNRLAPKYNNNATVVDVVDTILPVLEPGYGWYKLPDGSGIGQFLLPDGGYAPADSDYLTYSDETADLPNSVQIQNLGTALTSGIGLPAGTTAQRPIPLSPNVGLRLNTTTNTLEYYDHVGMAWVILPSSSSGSFLPLSGGTMTGAIVLAGDATAALNPVTLQQFQAALVNTHPACLVASAGTDSLSTWTYNNGASGVGATLTAPGNGATTFDTTVIPVDGDSVFVIDQASNLEWQGPYTIVQGTAGTPTVLTRRADFNQAAEMNAGDKFTVVSGTVYGGHVFMFTQVAAITVGTTDLTFSDITNTGLGTMALQNANAVAITGGTIDGTVIGGVTPAAGTFTTLAANTSLYTPLVIDANGNEVLGFTGIASAVNYIEISNNATGQSPSIIVLGSDTDINMQFGVKGNGSYAFRGNTSTQTRFQFYENETNGTHSLQLRAPSALANDLTIYEFQETAQTGYVAWDQTSTPAWTDWTPTFTGFSVAPSIVTARYKKIGKTCFVQLTTEPGTSNATTFTVTNLPFTSANYNYLTPLLEGTNNSVEVYSIVGIVEPSSTTLTLLLNGNSAAWTAALNKRVIGQFCYETA